MSIFSKFSMTSLLLCSLLGGKDSIAQEVFPQPQTMHCNGGTLHLDGTWSIQSKSELSSQMKELFANYFTIKSGKQDHTIRINRFTKRDPLAKKEGAYKISIKEDCITITTNSERGVFYALQTISQLIESDKNQITLPHCEITDYPDVAFRGTVEGFYGEPWSHTDRIEQLKFYGKLKLNTYIYGPKDDPYHSSPHWRKPYPSVEAERIKELVEVAKENYVDFVWAIHPGKDIQWNLADSLAIIKKFDMMYDLGVRSFAVFFDDISGIGTDANKQADILNYIQKEFLDKKKDNTPLVMCPTQYNKAWSDPKPGTYLDILGDKLHPNVQIMWTGNTVVHDITTEGLQWVNKRIKRPTYVWWNFPVSDYVRDHLLMGPSYGIETDAKDEMIGFVSNPMDKAEPSKVAIFSVANYSWNMQEYNPNENWEDACEYVMPEATEAFTCFNRHNADPGHNWHRYRRDESTEIAPVIDSYVSALDKGKYDMSSAEKLQDEFALITASAEEIKDNCLNARLVEQITPWLKQFSLLGRVGQESLSMIAAVEENDLKTTWEHFINSSDYLAQMDYIDRHENQNPFQPGVKTGSLRLMPFIHRLNQVAEQHIFQQTGDATQKTVLTSAPTVYTSISRLQHQKLNDRGGKISLTPILEIMNFDKGEFIGLSWGKNRIAKKVEFNFGENQITQKCVIEISTDGTNWKNAKTKVNGAKVTIEEDLAPIHYVRIKAKESFPIRLNELTATTQENSEIKANYYAMDNNLTSYQAINGGKVNRYLNPKEGVASKVTILYSDATAPIIIKGLDDKKVEKTLFIGNKNVVEIENHQLSEISIWTSGKVKVHEIIWK